MRTDTLLKAVQSYLSAEKNVATNRLREAERESLKQHVEDACKRLEADAATAAAPVEATPAKPLFRRIMVAVDNSLQAGFAINVAAELAKSLHSELCLVHVAHIPPPTNPDLAYEQFELEPMCLEAGQKLLDQTADRLSGVAPIEKVLRQGDPATEIADVANRLGADLIVMGTHGRGRFTAAVVGSVAQGVMRHVTCPVLCVAHDPAELNTVRHQAREKTPDDYFPAGIA